MPQESVCIKVPKNCGEKAIRLANKLKIIDKELKIQKDADSICIPLTRRPRKKELEEFEKHAPGCGLSTYAFPKRKKPPKTLEELLKDKLPSHLLLSLPHAMDVVGRIAVVELPPELDAYANVIGEAALKLQKNVRTVLAKAGAVSGTYRLREYKVIAGEPNTETVHKEYGCQYHVDLAKAYFSPRLSYEHNRVASLIEEGETIVDMFTGVGPFAILIAKTHENVEVYAIDSNPNAIDFLKENVLINRVSGRVHPILGDAKEVIERSLTGIADHVIMNLPEKAIDFVDAACETLKPTGGIVHFYTFVDSSMTLEEVKARFTNEVEECGRSVDKILSSRLVRSTAPHEWQAVLDSNIH